MAHHRHSRHQNSRWTRFGIVAVTSALFAGTFVASGMSPAGAQSPKPGGEVRMGLEAETTGGYCLNQAQLVVSGIQVAAALYDTLTAPNSKGEYVPNLAESVTPNATFNEFTIKVRPNIKFHNGEALNADAVKQNIEAWRVGRLFTFVYSNIASVDKVDDLTVKVTTKTPWPAFPAYLYLQGRAGVMAPAQVGNPDTCATNMIGTGPFKLDSWKVNEALTASKNPNYWKKDKKGNQLPYLDKITFVPIPDSPSRDTQLQGGQLDMMHTSSATSIIALKSVSGVKLALEPAGNRETRYYLVNSQRPPFNDPNARKALATALNTKEINTIRNRGLFTTTGAIIDTKSPGYLKNNGIPKFNLKEAQKLVEQVKAANGGSFPVTLLAANDSENVSEMELMKEQLTKAGMTVEISAVDQSSLVNELLGGKFSVTLIRNFHSDPAFGDASNYVWWAKGSPVNFGRIDDPTIQAALDTGRTATDEAARTKAYDDFNKAMGAGVYLVPGWYSQFAIGTKNVAGVKGAPLPDGSTQKFMNARIPVDGLFKTK